MLQVGPIENEERTTTDAVAVALNHNCRLRPHRARSPPSSPWSSSRQPTRPQMRPCCYELHVSTRHGADLGDRLL